MRWLAGVFAGLAILAAGCGGTTSAGAGAADVIPASAPAFIALNTDVDSSQWQTLDDLASRFPDKEKAVDAVKQSMQEEGLDWERDIKPALGPEFDLVWLDFENDGMNFVGLMQPKDEDAFKRLVKKGPDIPYEKVGDWYVYAGSKDTIERFRRESGSGESLADKKAFNEAMDDASDDWLFRAYVDGAAVMDRVRREGDPDFQKALKLGSLDWFATNLGVTSDGIRWDMTVHGKPGPGLRGISPTRPFTPALAKEIPKDSFAYFTFHGAKGMLTGLKKNPLLKEVPELRRYSGVLSRIETLLQGENALYVRPSGNKIPEVTFVAEPAPGTDGASTLDQLLRQYRTQLELRALPKRTRVAGVPARVVFADPVRIYYANVGNRLVVTDSTAGIKALLGNPPSIAQSEDYKGTLDSAGMPSRTQGFLYIDVRGGIDYAQRLAKTPLPAEVKRNLRPLRSAVEYAATRPSEIQVTFFLRIT